MEDKIREYIVFFEQTTTELGDRSPPLHTRKLVKKYFPRHMVHLTESIKRDLRILENEGAGRGIRVEAEVTGIYQSPEYEKFELSLD